MTTKIMHFVRWETNLYVGEMEFETLQDAMKLVRILHRQGLQATMRAEERRCV